jgi:hypothetical protein
MLADAADESLVLVRSMDREQLDLATLHATIANFVEVWISSSSAAGA